MTVKPTATLGTEAWQPEFIEQRRSDVGGYLEQTSQTDLIQRVAACSVELMGPLEARAVLEVGCGNGVFLPRLATAVGRNGRVVGIDHSEVFVADAQARAKAAGLGDFVTVQQADAYRLPFGDSTFDVAHCERVLMHLENPSAALAEMKRVVKSGGWIVAAEPDWAGIRIDHPDRSGMDLLFARSMPNKQPDVGLTLYRRMAEIGVSERRADPVLGVFTDYEIVKGYGVSLLPAADALVREGALTRARADALLMALEGANEIGRYYSVGVMHVVAGRVQK